jgi:predicted dehydrogenase
MEKPLAPTLAEARAILIASRQYGVHLTVSFVHRYRSEFQRAHQLISQGELGTLSMILDVYGLPGGRHIPGWVWQSHKQGGGILMYSGIHSLDWQRWLVGSDVVEVFAQVAPHSQDSDAESSLVANLRFANGCLGALIGNQPGYPVTPRTRSTEIYGSKACLKLRAGEHLEFSSNNQAYRLEVTRDDPFVAQAREFVAAVRKQRDPWITGEDGLQAQATVLAIFRSAESGQPVAVADVLES